MARTMAFSDRVVFALRARRRNARTLSRMFGKDVSDVYKVLEGLEDLGIVRRLDEARDPVVWELEEEVEVDYRPNQGTGEVVVDVGGRDPRRTDGDRCTALTTSGDQCKNGALEGQSVCQVHAD